jgi:holo-[acyl-carrier protein] synthase
VIVAIGLDIVELARVRGVWQRHPERFLTRHFTPAELHYCLAKRDPLPSLAARFAAKEAFQKCWPQAHRWRDVWVEHQGARPVLAFAEPMAEALAQEQLVAHLSLSHSRDYAAAVVVLERVTSQRTYFTCDPPP